MPNDQELHQNGDSDIEQSPRGAVKDTIKYGLNGEYQKYKLIEKRQYNHNCYIFRFELQSSLTVLGLPIGNHIMLKYDDKNIEFPIMRAYTPISNNLQYGYFELLIKIYDDGEMTQKLNNLKINSYLECKGPLGSINYVKPSQFKISQGIDKYRILNVNKIAMLAGGTGITPFYQIIKYIDKNKENDKTKISLIFSNKTENDILLKNELYKIIKENKNIKIYFTLSSVDAKDNEQWNGGFGRINSEMIINNIFEPNDDVVVMYCGPAGFNKAMKKLLPQIGYQKTNIFKF